MSARRPQIATTKPRQVHVARLFKRLGLWGIVGLVVNVLIAWGATLVPIQWAYMRNTSPVWPGGWPGQKGQWPRPVPSGWPSTWTIGGEDHFFVLSVYNWSANVTPPSPVAPLSATAPVSKPVLVPTARPRTAASSSVPTPAPAPTPVAAPVSGPLELYSMSERRYGFPFRSLGDRWMSTTIFTPPATSEHTSSRSGSINIPIGQGLAWSPPIRPVWPGFLLNTLVWGGLIPVTRAVLNIPIAARRRHRRRLGQCDACGYDLLDTPVGAPCPECGNVAG